MIAERIALITGKGGVGKSTVAAALAKRWAQKGHRVLLIEVSATGDDASPLAAMFGLSQFPREGMKVAPNVFAMIALAQVGQERFVSEVIKSRTLGRAALASRAVQRLLATAPSARELGVLFHMLTEVRRRNASGFVYDKVVIDMPASGHALGITQLPKLLLGLVRSGAIAETLREGEAYFCDAEMTRAIVVCLPETLAVSEAIEVGTGLEEDGVSVGAFVVNQVIDSALSDTQRQYCLSTLDGDWLGRHSLLREQDSRQSCERLQQHAHAPIVQLPHVARGDVVGALRGIIEGTHVAG